MAFNGKFVYQAMNFASTNAEDLRGLLEISGESIDSINSEECIISDDVYSRVLEASIAIKSDALFGLHMAESLNISAGGLVMQIVQSAETVHQAMQVCCDYSNLACSAMPYFIKEAKDHYILQMNPKSDWEKKHPNAVRHTAEGNIAFMIRAFSNLTLMKNFPISVYLPWENKSSIEEYERVFQCPVLFNKSGISIQFRKEHFEAKINSANYELFSLLLGYAEKRSSELRAKKDIVSTVRESICQLMNPGFPDIYAVASQLNMSQRTLQRKLKERSTSFKKLVDELKKEFALNYMGHQDTSLSNIAYLLDYSDPSAFSRAFKNWYGKSPQEYRAEL